MSTHKKFDVICVVVILCALVITVLFMNGEKLGLIPVADEDSPYYRKSDYFTANDLNGDWDDSSATKITLTGDSAKISGNGAYCLEGDLIIAGGGYYVIEGTLDDGSIIVDAYESSKVWIRLNGADVYCSDNAALIVKQAEKVFVTLSEGTQNRFAGGSDYSEEALQDNVNAVIYARDDLTINGSGSLTVTGQYRQGIVAKDDLTITGGTIAVSAPKDGIHVNDSFSFCDAALEILAEDDGIVQERDEEILYVESGSISIESGDDAVSAVSSVLIAGGDLTIAAGDDGIHSDDAITVNGGTLLITECYEGLEALTIEINGGETTIYPEDDGLNANGGSGDGFGMMGGFGGMNGGPAATDMNGDSAGGEAEDGAVSVQDGDSAGGEAEDRAVSVQNGDSAGGEAEDGAVSVQNGDSAAADTCILISGGSLTIINRTGSDADGLDSNGDIYITGGTVRISLINSGSNSAIDYGSESGGVCEISGGTVVAAGSYMMAEQFDSTSEQCSILYTYSAGIPSGTEVSLEDADGNAILSWVVPCSFSAVSLSCPELTLDETYKVVIGDSEEEITLTEVSAGYGDAQSGGFGGPMNFGEMQPRQGMTGRGESEGLESEGEMPSFAEGEMPSFAEGESRGMPVDAENRQNIQDDEEETVASGKLSITDLEPKVWIWLGVSAAVILGGLLAAFLYRKNHF
ncbi:MAG: carbohydrate-binding domain-containing protein [Parasporobacterium sp.]|nr:carbohydrate-binding domain-containing protein [Parasporobacterium sp.]